MKEKKDFHPVCPAPIKKYDRITLAHGGGGKLMNKLIGDVFIPAFNNDLLSRKHDSSVFELEGIRLAMTTDSYVVSPLFFPGGDIGSLSIHGTVNDLAMSGAKPLFLSAGVIIEEGFSIDSMKKIAASMNSACERACVKIITGDTKVVDKGKGDGIFINTAGIGILEHSLDISPTSIKSGDAILLNGDIGRHGIAILSAREGLSFETDIESDTAFLHNIALDLIKNSIDVHCMRDLTRGGLASALNEISDSSKLSIEVIENNIMVLESVRGACEILGFDPLYVANEGRMVVFVPDKQCDKALNIMRKYDTGKNSCRIGTVKDNSSLPVIMKTCVGTHRILDMLSGEQLPRIC